MEVFSNIVNLVHSLHEFSFITVRIDSEEPDAFQLNLYGEHIIREALEYGTSDIFIKGRWISNLQCADDITLIASDEEKMMELINLVKMASEKLALCKSINVLKTKVMVVD